LTNLDNGALAWDNMDWQASNSKAVAGAPRGDCVIRE